MRHLASAHVSGAQSAKQDENLQAGGRSGSGCGVSAGQAAGWLARVMMASAVRVVVPPGPAWGKLLGHFALRARCRFRLTTVRNLAMALVRAV